MRILTPEEINELTTFSEAEEMISLTKMVKEAIGEAIPDDGKAKIIPFDPQKGNKEGTLLPTDAKKEESEIPADKMALVDFIFRQKEKFSKSHRKLKGKEIFNLYVQNVEKEIGVKSKEKKAQQEEMAKVLGTGILVNKKAS